MIELLKMIILKNSKNKTCAKYPSVYDMNFNNIYWQQLETSNGTFFLYAAYLDVRYSYFIIMSLHPLLCILTELDLYKRQYCQPLPQIQPPAALLISRCCIEIFIWSVCTDHTNLAATVTAFEHSNKIC